MYACRPAVYTKLWSYKIGPDGEIGRRARLKIESERVGVRVPLWVPKFGCGGQHWCAAEPYKLGKAPD